MYKSIIFLIVLSNLVPCYSMDNVCFATKENSINFQDTNALTTVTKETLKQAPDKNHYPMMNSVCCYQQTPEALRTFQGYLNHHNIPVNFSVCKDTSLLDLYVTDGIITGNFLPLQQYLYLGADPEYSLNGIAPIILADGLRDIDASRSNFAISLLQFYTDRKHQTKKQVR